MGVARGTAVAPRLLPVTRKFIRQTAGCQIERQPGWLRASVGPSLAAEVQECYRAVAMECLHNGCHRVLIVGSSSFDATAHIAGRDALRSLALAGVPDGFRLALVALTPDLVDIYDDAVLDADRLGIEARRFGTEAEAERWLAA